MWTDSENTRTGDELLAADRAVAAFEVRLHHPITLALCVWRHVEQIEMSV